MSLLISVTHTSLEYSTSTCLEFQNIVYVIACVGIKYPLEKRSKTSPDMFEYEYRQYVKLLVSIN